MCIARTFSAPGHEPANSIKSLPSEKHWHALTAPEILEAFAVNPAQGLTESEVDRRRTHYGANAFKEFRPRPAWRVLIDQFASIVIALLGVAALVAWATGDTL